MAISRHNANTGQASSTTTVSATLAVNSGEIVVVYVNQEATSGAVLTVSGVSDGVNTYAKRFSASASGANEPTFAASEGTEVWWALATTTTTLTITATLSGTFDDAVIVLAGYQGFTGTAYQTNPWDSNASLPKTNQSAATSSGTATGISTTSTAGMLIAAHSSCDNGILPTAPAGFSLAGQLSNTGATNAVQGNLWDKVYSSAQSSITVTTTGSTNGWIFYVDALTDGGAGGATLNTAWFHPSEELLPRKFLADRFHPPPAFVSTFRTAAISGIGWHRDFPEANPRPPVRFQPPPAFVSTFKTAVISGIAFSRNEPESSPRPPRRFEIPPAWAPQPIGQVVTAPPNGWWRNESEILPRAPIRFAPPGVFISTFQTAPISGIAWFEPPDQNRAPAKTPIDYPTPILLPAAPPPTGWWTQSDKAQTKRLNTSDPPSFVFPQVVVTWSFAVSDTIKARVPPRDEPPAFGSPPATTPVGISGLAWFAPWPPDIINRGVNWLTAPAWAPQFIDQVVPPPPVVSPLDRHFICDVGRLMGWG